MNLMRGEKRRKKERKLSDSKVEADTVRSAIAALDVVIL
jgi:hypothetical protein